MVSSMLSAAAIIWITTTSIVAISFVQALHFYKKDETVIEDKTGLDVVQAAIDTVQDTCILGNSHQFINRIAQTTNYGQRLRRKWNLHNLTFCVTIDINFY